MVPWNAALTRELHQLSDALQKLLGGSAAGAAVLQLDGVLRGRRATRLLGHERRVDVYLRHVVHDEAHLDPGLVLEQVL